MWIVSDIVHTKCEYSSFLFTLVIRIFQFFADLTDVTYSSIDVYL